MADYFAGSVQYDHNGGNVKRACDKMLEDSKNLSPVSCHAF